MLNKAVMVDLKRYTKCDFQLSTTVVRSRVKMTVNASTSSTDFHVTAQRVIRAMTAARVSIDITIAVGWKVC